MLYLQIASPKSSVLNFLDSNSFEVIISIFQRTEKVPDMERLRYFPVALHTMFFKNAIFSTDDLKNKTAHDLFLICERDYPLTMKAYYSLKKNGIMFEDWEDKYLFEVLSKKTSSLMWQKYEIVKVSQFVDYSEAQLEEIISLYPKLSRIVKTRLQEH